MGLGLAVATVELGPLGSALFLAPPLMMRFVVKQYTERTAGAVERLETANAELVAASSLLAATAVGLSVAWPQAVSSGSLAKSTMQPSRLKQLWSKVEPM